MESKGRSQDSPNTGEDFGSSQYTESHDVSPRNEHHHHHQHFSGKRRSHSSVNSSVSNEQVHSGEGHEGEIDALGIMHNDILSDSSTGNASDSVIDHRTKRNYSVSGHRKRDSLTHQAEIKALNKRGSIPSATRYGSILKTSTNTPGTSPPHSKSRPIQSDSKFSNNMKNRSDYPISSPSTKVFNNNIFATTPGSRGAYSSPTLKRNPYTEFMKRRDSSKDFNGYQSDPNEEALNNENDSSDSNSVYASSNPSSRRSSNASSLDDVCFPVDSINDEGERKLWPDVRILEQFADEEKEREKKINFNSFQLNKRLSKSTPSAKEDNVGFSYPIVSNIEESSVSEPLMGKNYTENQYSSTTTGWQGSGETIYPLLMDKQTEMERLRFTYFREDLRSTIHSPNLSGLLKNEDCRTFADLFVPVSVPVSDSEEALQTNLSALMASGAVPSAISRFKSPPPISQSNTASLKSMNDSTVFSSSSSELNPFWLDVLDPTEEELKTISKAFGIHPLTTEDIFLGETREKVEIFKDYYFVCFTSFDIVQEHARKKELEKNLANSTLSDDESSNGWFSKTVNKLFGSKSEANQGRKYQQSMTSKKRKSRRGDLEPLNMYTIVFRDGVITFHFKATPHPTNVRRRARLLRDYLTVSSDWIGYALIDDITDAFAPMIESIELEVNSIEDAILLMQSGKDSDDESDSDDEDDEDDNAFVLKLKRRGSGLGGPFDRRSLRSSSSKSSRSSDSSANTRVISWRRKGDMLRRIGDCRKKVMSILRLLSFKADVIKGFAKRCNEQWDSRPRSEIAMYLSDIQDHIITMVQALNHYEKLLARSHSNYLAQINIDMTKVNNDMNDVLGKITILGAIVLPLNIVTGLWGMNVLVPGQDAEGLTWFYVISGCLFVFALIAYFFTRKIGQFS